MGEHEESHLVLYVAIAAGAIAAVFVAGIVVSEVRRDRWELKNAVQVSAKLDEADQLQKSDPLTAYKTYDEVLKEAKKHKVTDEQFSKRLAVAEKAQAAVYPKVQDKLRAEEAEKQRLAQVEAERAAEERRKIAEEKEQALAAERAQRIAAEKQQAEEKRRKAAIAAYRNLPQSARAALNVLKKVEARTEIGLSYSDYSTVVGEAWGEVKVFAESPEGKAIPDFSMMLANAIADYKSALKAWHDKIEYPALYGPRIVDLSVLMQRCWSRAGRRISLAEALLDAEKTEKTLETIAKDQENDEDFDATMRSMLPRK